MTANMPVMAETVITDAFRCDSALAAIVAAKAQYRDFAPRTTILEAGTRAAALYLVLAGRAQALVYSLDGRLVLVDEFHPGDFFGEAGLFDTQDVMSDVSAVDAVCAGTFLTHIFIGLMENYSAIAISMSRLLTARLVATSRRMVEGATLSAAGRIHAELLRQARAATDMTISPPPVLSLFAQHVLSTRETVSRTINALQKRGIIRRDENSLTVVAPHRLEELIY